MRKKLPSMFFKTFPVFLNPLFLFIYLHYFLHWKSRKIFLAFFSLTVDTAPRKRISRRFQFYLHLDDCIRSNITFNFPEIANKQNFRIESQKLMEEKAENSCLEALADVDLKRFISGKRHSRRQKISFLRVFSPSFSQVLFSLLRGGRYSQFHLQICHCFQGISKGLRNLLDTFSDQVVNFMYESVDTNSFSI